LERTEFQPALVAHSLVASAIRAADDGCADYVDSDGDSDEQLAGMDLRHRSYHSLRSSECWPVQQPFRDHRFVAEREHQNLFLQRGTIWLGARFSGHNITGQAGTTLHGHNAPLPNIFLSRWRPA